MFFCCCFFKILVLGIVSLQCHFYMLLKVVCFCLISDVAAHHPKTAVEAERREAYV